MDRAGRYNRTIDEAIERLKLIEDAGVDYVELGPKPSLEVLFNIIAGCTLCALHKRKKSTATINRGLGGLRAELAFVLSGELIEGSEEHDLLTKMTAAMGLALKDIYITSAVKCVTDIPEQDNEEPLKACKGFLLREMKYVSPSVIVTLGVDATRALITSPLPFNSLRGRFQTPASRKRGDSSTGFQVMPTHPLNILVGNLNLKKETWSDLKKIMARLKLKPAQ